MARSIERLPPEIQQLILGYLSTHESSLRAFACANRNCHIQASPFVYHTFQVELNPDQAPLQISSSWAQDFRDFSRLQYVKCLVICKTQPGAYSCSSHAKDTGPRYTFLSGTPGNLKGYPRSYGCSPGATLDSGTQTALESNSVWLPLAHLIPQLPSLLDLLFLLPIQFPECLLNQIHATRPSCRLHIDRFFLRSVGTASTDPYEYCLASSPCLFRLGTIHDDGYLIRGEIAPSCYHEDAVARMASGLAPNLREIRLVYPLPAASPMQYTPPEWKGFSQERGGKAKRKRGNLRLLRFEHWWCITQHRLDYWSMQTDFTQLHALEFDAYLSSDILRHLATKFHLPCLKTLVLSNLRNEREHSDDGAEAANELLRSLPPLMSLTLHGWCPEISIDAFAIHHGPRLRELKLLNYPGGELTKDGLQALGRHCIFLQDLTLSLRRSQGDSTEANLYKALGSLPRLQSVSLDLHIAESYSPEDIVEDDEGNLFNPAFDDEFDQKVPSELLEPGPDSSEVCNGTMREQLINCAFDKILARSIFDAISSGKPQISLPLEVLTVKITNAGEVGLLGRPAHFLSVLFRLCRPWRISRSIRDDRRHEIQVEEIEQIPNRLLPPQALKSWLEAIWRRIWPEKGSEEWQYSWHSFPISEVV